MDSNPIDDSYGGLAANSVGGSILHPAGDLCPQCQTVVDAMFDCLEPVEFPHLNSLSAFEKSSRAGCCLCCQFLHQLMGTRDKLPREGLEATMGAVTATAAPGEDVAWLKAHCVVGGITRQVSQLLVSRATNQAEDYASPDRRANTIAAVPLCRRWLEECRASHPQCRGNETLHSIVPTRLLDIGNGGPRIRLAAEVSRKGHNIKYATLSHCWGAEPFATLTSANLESFRQQVPIEAITKTFSDAIHIARALGFCYLWIDSLCIIQDSVEDWERESSQMTQVYGDSDLTIAATSAKDGRGGCFFGRGPNRRCRVRQSSSPVLWDVYRYPYRHPLQCNSLDTRAWALQERYLSRRMLHFAHDEVFWDCDGNPASETFPYGYPLGMGGREYLGLTVQKRPLTRQKWRLIVEDYSKRDLTKSSDRFPAIAGLAKLIQEQTKDEYVAGMWREGLAYQLAWYSFTTEGMTGPYIAPSWSWATSRKIRFPQYHEHTLESSQLHIQVDSIDIQYATSNRLGEILAGKVRLRCDILCRAVVRLVSGRVTLLIGNKVIDDVDVYPGFVMHTQIGRDVHALIITHGTAASSLCTGLLLKPANRTRGEYQRLGAYRSVYFPSTSRSGDSGLCEKAMAEENLVALDRVDHFAKVSTEDGLKRYFIDLV